jgi:uncharacterized protein (DUF2235 family)
MGGGLAIGLSENVREAYGFLAHNFQVSDNGQPDEIYLLGFSRGAFTARSVGGLIASLGLLTKEAMEYFYYIFEYHHPRTALSPDILTSEGTSKMQEGVTTRSNYQKPIQNLKLLKMQNDFRIYMTIFKSTRPNLLE